MTKPDTHFSVRSRPRASLGLATTLAMLLTACSEPASESTAVSAPTAADTVYTNARVYTVDAANSWAEAFAVKDGAFIAVGSAAEMQQYTDDQTDIVDLEGRMVMPGIHDMHAHLSQAGTKELFECGFPFSLGVDEIVTQVSECAQNATEGEWIRGGQWAMELLDSDTPPARAMLDAAAPNNPVLLIDSTVHAVWVNSKALEMLGVDDDTADPVGGVIERDDKGAATGVLFDNAAYQQLSKLPMYSESQMQDALAWSIAQFNQVGVTALKDAMVDAPAAAGYAALAANHRLNATVATSLAWRMAWAGPQDSLERTIESRSQYASANVQVDFAKIMLDGIPPSQTAAVLEPYIADGKHPEGHRGYLTQTPESLQEDITALDARGLTVKVHATGDRSVRAVLDAVEAARAANGDSGLRHEVSHAEMIHADDLPRFAKLGVTAEMCPILWYPSPLHSMMESALGVERSSRFWQARSLMESGALVIYGSDWPSVVPSANPWPGIEAMVTRADPYGVNQGMLAPEEALDLATVLRIFTINGAESMYRADQSGSIERGKSADFIVLNQNLFDIAPAEIGDTEVLQTVFQGRTVYIAGAN